jgi:hypothetical protein
MAKFIHGVKFVLALPLWIGFAPIIIWAATACWRAHCKAEQALEARRLAEQEV